MNGILERLQAGEILVSDGAMGTLLHARGLRPGECPESWCVTHPDAVREIAAAYLAAGADIVETNSFGGSSFKLAGYGMGARVREFNRAAAVVAKQAADGKGFVAGSVGPTGHILEAEGGDVLAARMYDAFAEQIEALAEGGADAICIETMSSLGEALQALRAAKDHCGLPVMCTFTFESGVKGFRTIMGVRPDRAAQAAAEAGADIIGANCGNGIANMIEIAAQMKSAGKPVLIQANAGAPSVENGRTVYKEDPEYMASRAPALVEAGANIIGGCCGTSPAHIAAIAAAVKAYCVRQRTPSNDHL